MFHGDTGISATTGRPFSPPTAFRTVGRPKVGKMEKAYLQEGKCHRCKKWVPVEGIKDVPTKVRCLSVSKESDKSQDASAGQGDLLVSRPL